MCVSRGFELKTARFTYREYNGGLIIHPVRPEGYRRRPGQDRLEGVIIISPEHLPALVQALSLLSVG